MNMQVLMNMIILIVILISPVVISFFIVASTNKEGTSLFVNILKFIGYTIGLSVLLIALIFIMGIIADAN